MLIGVPWRNIESWRLFAGPLAREFQLETLDKPISGRSLRLLWGPDPSNPTTWSTGTTQPAE